MPVFLLLVFAILAPAAPAPKPATLAAGRKEMLTACRNCHPLQVIELRRFPREDWDRVLVKMTELGAKIRNREALLAYLTARYGEKDAPGPAKR